MFGRKKLMLKLNNVILLLEWVWVILLFGGLLKIVNLGCLKFVFLIIFIRECFVEFYYGNRFLICLGEWFYSYNDILMLKFDVIK